MPKAETRDGSQYCDVLWLNGNYIQQEDFILEIIQLYYKIFTNPFLNIQFMHFTYFMLHTFMRRVGNEIS